MSVKLHRPSSGTLPCISTGSQRLLGMQRLSRWLAVGLAVAGLSLLSPTVSADVYRWVEADGTVNYGERAPRGRDYTVISRSTPAPGNKRGATNRPAPGPVQQPPQAAGQDDADNLSDRQRAMLERLQEAEQVRQEEIAKIRESNCATSKRVLSNMQARGRIRVRTEDGGEEAMTDEDRNERIRQAQESIAVNCDSLS